MTTTQQMVLSENAWIVMCKRYFLRGEEYQTKCLKCGEGHETVEQFVERVSMGNAEYRDELIVPLHFLPNSPTLMNIGNPAFNGTLSACFKFDVEDTMFDSPSGIMPVMMKAAKVLKAGGGVGYSFHVRPKGALVHSTHGSALGSGGVMMMYHEMAKQITQGGKRSAAQMGILRCDDPDLMEFIHFKDEDPDGLGTFNISVAITDEWMGRAQIEGTPEYAALTAIAESSWKTGDPGVFFIDTAERGNPTPWLGKLTGTNPCGEVPLLDNEPCNLGSINLGRVLGEEMKWERLERITRLGIRYLDDVLDRNVFPDQAITDIALLTRKLGEGVCGFADLLIMLRIQYDSEEALTLADHIMADINAWALDESLKLADEKGMAPAYASRPQGAGSRYPRNATRTCIAPTGTIAIIMDASSGIEPLFALENERRMEDGTLMLEKRAVVEQALQFYNFVPHTSHEIDASWHIQMQAAFQASTDLAVSKTINMPNSATPEEIREAFVLMFTTACKGGTIYRNDSRENQVLTLLPTGGEGKDTSVVRDDGYRHKLPDERNAVNHKFIIGDTRAYINVGLFSDGVPGEVFLNVSRQGTSMDGFADWWAMTFSIALQTCHKYGIPFTVFTEKYKGTQFEPSGLTRNPAIPKATSIADYIARWLELRFSPVSVTLEAGAVIEQAVQIARGFTSGNFCPTCSSQLRREEGCQHCPVCGYEEC